MEHGLLVLIAAVVGGGVLGALLRAWSFHARLYSLESRLVTVETGLLREQKVRASEVRWKKATKEEELIEAAMNNPAPSRPKFWWEQYVKAPAVK